MVVGGCGSPSSSLLFFLQLCSPLFPLFPLSALFFLLCSGFVEVLLVVERKPVMAAVFSSPLQRRCFFSWFPLFPLSTLFFPLYNSFMEVQVVGNGWDEDDELSLVSESVLLLLSSSE
jgi:hypothetical protein